jgi:putative aldouronate transport system permease protein
MVEIQKALNTKALRRVNFIRRHWMYYAMLVLPVTYFIVFKYIPMPNIAIAFKDYNLFQGVWNSPWVGEKWFAAALRDKDFPLILRNTIMLNFLDLAIGFPAPVILALILNELNHNGFKRVAQTVVYLPHFLSWIVIGAIASQLLATHSGILNIFMAKLGIEPVNFLMDSKNWIGVYVSLGIWKEMGWGTIIYLAAITGINSELYEAAEVDGAGRFGKIWHVTLPGIRSTIAVLLILSLGRILGSEFDRPYNLSNGMVKDVSDVIATFVYRVGIRGFQFSYTAAIGLFQSVVCVMFLVLANTLAKKAGEQGIW